MAKENKGRKPSKKVIRWNRSFVVLAALLVLVLGIVGTTLAWLTDTTEDQTNTFEYAKVSCQVLEDVNSNETLKKNVRIQNTGNTDAYIRATYVVTYRDDTESILYEPLDRNWNVDLSNKINTESWVQGKDGYWYCKTPVAPGKETPALFKEPISGNGRFLNDGRSKERAITYVEILATAIQSQPVKAMGEAWGYTMNNGTLTPYTSGN